MFILSHHSILLIEIVLVLVIASKKSTTSSNDENNEIETKVQSNENESAGAMNNLHDENLQQNTGENGDVEQNVNESAIVQARQNGDLSVSGKSFKYNFFSSHLYNANWCNDNNILNLFYSYFITCSTNSSQKHSLRSKCSHST